MNDGNFSCSMCYFTCNTRKRLAMHVVRSHRYDPNFIVYCDIDGCMYNSRSWNAYKLHISRKHKNNNDFIIDEEIEMDYVDTENESPSAPANTENILNKRQLSVAQYMLKLEADHTLSQNALNEVAESTSLFLSQMITDTKQKIAHHLDDHNIDESVLADITPHEHIFEPFMSPYLRGKFYTDKCNLLHSEDVLLGTLVKRTSKGLKTIPHHGRIIPFRKNLEVLLNMPEVWNFVCHPRIHSDGLMRDYCDGSYIQTNPLFNSHPRALQIIFSHDDFEIVNPLGSHVKKHKIAAFYFTLANIPPQHRSKLTAIQLVCLAKSKDLRRFGTEKLLKDFVSTICEMQRNGIDMEVNGTVEKIYGTLIACPCDTLAAQWLGGFKEGVSFARQACRTCTGDRNSMTTNFMANSFQERSLAQHVERCKDLDGLSKASRIYWSKLWGINRRSILLDIENFNPAHAFIHDPMHILLEGIIPYEMALVLYHCIYYKKYFKLSWLNSQMKGYPYSFQDINSRPESIDKDHITVNHKIKQTSAAMLTLCFTLPHIIGFKIDENDERWMNFITLQQILILSTSPYADNDSAGQLEQLIATHNYNFVKLYPKCSIIPKLHYAVHLSQQILRYGPLRHQWVMRFEAKHGFFKNMKWKCFKNILKTMAEKHQLYMCSKMITANGSANGNFIYEGDLISEGITTQFSSLYPNLCDELKEICRRNIINLDVDLTVYVVNSVQIHGHAYKNGAFLLLSWADNFPNFCCIDNIIVVDNTKLFVVDILETLQFVKMIGSYKLKYTSEKKLVPYSDLVNKWPLGGYFYNEEVFIVNRYCHFVEFL